MRDISPFLCVMAVLRFCSLHSLLTVVGDYINTGCCEPTRSPSGGTLKSTKQKCGNKHIPLRSPVILLLTTSANVSASGVAELYPC
jgi:hypothetical protein